MFQRILSIALNTYREAVRARVLHGLLGLALATTLYSIVLGTLSLHHDARVVADFGAASTSIYSAAVAIVLGATSLYREVELKTIFPILTRKLRRHEYVLGKYAGMLLTLAVFIALDGALVLFILGVQGHKLDSFTVGLLVFALVSLVALLRSRRLRTYAFLPWALGLLGAAYVFAEKAGAERQLVVAGLALTLAESAILSAVALLFSSFSSPFLTAILSILVFLIGRSADTLANLPARFLGPEVRSVGKALSRVFPNLHIYAPPRPLLLGEVDGSPVGMYVLRATLLAVAYSVALLSVSAAIFRKRDFQ